MENFTKRCLPSKTTGVDKINMSGKMITNPRNILIIGPHQIQIFRGEFLKTDWMDIQVNHYYGLRQLLRQSNHLQRQIRAGISINAKLCD